MTQELFPPKDGWICPECEKKHSKPHWEFEDQVDKSKRVGQEGRIKFGRELKDEPNGNSVDPEMDCKRSDMKTGNPTREIDGIELQNPLFCSHCGFLQDVINIIKVKRKK